MTRATLTAFVDCLFLIIFILVLLPHNPEVSQAEEAVPPGSVVVQVEWQPGINVDVDLWTQAPGDIPVGYSNKGGAFFSLLRDDLGNDSDTTPLNVEYAYSRGQPAGEYTVNLHLYRNGAGLGAIPCRVQISTRGLSGAAHVIFTRDVVLEHQGQELTVQRFTLDEHGGVVAESRIPKALRSARQ